MQPTIENRDAASSRMKGSARKRLAVACAALFFAGLLAAATVPAFSSEPTGPRVVGQLGRFPADVAKALGVSDLKAATSGGSDSGAALMSTKLDRLYQIYNMKRGSDGGPHADSLVLAERDLETLTLQRTLIVPRHQAWKANGTSGAEWVATFDDNHDRLYVAYKPNNGLNDTIDQNLPGMLGIDLHTFEYTDSTFPNFMVGTADELLNLVGMEYDESTDTMLMLQSGYHGFSGVGNVLALIGWKAEDLLKGGRLPQVAPRLVRTCRRDPLNTSGSTYLTPILVAKGPDLDGDGTEKTWVTFPCYSTTFSSNVVIVRLDRATALDPQASQEKAVVAPAGVANWAMDATHGRLYLVNDSAETDGWVYEVSSNAFVGIIALSPKGKLESTATALGVDETSGRLYGRGPGFGFMITAGAQDPVPQADTYPGLSAPGAYRLLVDHKRNRVFSLPGTTLGNANLSDTYDIIGVPPPPAAPKREDPDARTAQVDETPGRTVPQYGGNASAYGLRVLLSRGISGVVPSNGNTDAGDVYKNANTYCGFTDRELVLARVAKTEFSNTSRFARAAAVDADNATIIDLATPSRCDLFNSWAGPPAPFMDILMPFLHTTGALSDLDRDGVPASETLNGTVGPHTTWDYKPADCASAEGQDEAGANTKPVVGDTSVTCDKDDEISAVAESRLKGADALDVTVARAKASTKVERNKEKGLVSTATSRLEGVNIAGISIGYIENSATSFAHGRTNTAGTVFNKPKIGYVDGPGVPSCTDQCDVDAVLKALNSALAGRAEFRRITPETRMAKGTPGGYEAGILKSEKQQASDNSLTGDKSVEVPAFELVVYNDNPSIGRARQVYQFAGVRADSHYGIQLAGVGEECVTCLADVGDTVDGVTGDVVDAGPALPNDGVPLAVRIPTNENTIHRAIRQTAAGANYSLRIIFSKPREAMLMATVWLLMWGPFVASRRRRALKAVTAADPEGPLLP
jgi:hypothetical protein